MNRPLLYIAGPYSSDPVLCSRAAILTATEVYRRTEFVPVVPHLTHFWHLLTPMDYEDWLTIDLSQLARCHAIMRLPGRSPGADREMAHAAELGLPVIPFDSMQRVVRDAFHGATP